MRFILPISFLAMEDAKNLERVAEVVEADAVVAEPQAQLRWLDIREALDVTVAGENVVGQVFEQADSGLTVDAADIGASLRCPLDVLMHPDQPRRR